MIAQDTLMTSFPKSEIKILLLEAIHPVAKEYFAQHGYDCEILPGSLSEDELVARIPEVHLLGLRSKTQVTPRVLAEARRLLAVGCFCIGTNQVALNDANGLGIPVFNAPFSNTRSVAELILAEVVMLSRHLGDRVRELHDGTWQKQAAGSHEVRGKTLGIIGYGHIGRQVGVLAEAFGLTVVFYDVAARLPMGNCRSVATLDDLLEISDYVTLHVPETPQTHGMIGARELSRMKRGAHLLNASRGTVVDLEAAAAALSAGHLGGLAVDVYPEEPAKNGGGFSTPLQGLSNVILTPHIGGSTEEAQENIGREVATALVRFVDTGATTGAVNFPQVELPPVKDAHRLLNVHRNMPGVLRDINRIVSETGANVRAQYLSTDPTIGYLITDIDVDKSLSTEIYRQISGLSANIRTRLLY